MIRGKKIYTLLTLLMLGLVIQVGWGSKEAKAEGTDTIVAVVLYYDMDQSGDFSTGDELAKDYPVHLRIVTSSMVVFDSDGLTNVNGYYGNDNVAGCPCSVSFSWDDSIIQKIVNPGEGTWQTYGTAMGLNKVYTPMVMQTPFHGTAMVAGPVEPILPASANEPNPQRPPAYIVFMLFYDTDQNSEVSDGDLMAANYPGDIYYTDADGILYAMDGDSNSRGLVDAKFEDCTCFWTMNSNGSARTGMLMPGDARIVKMLVPNRVFATVIIR